MTNDGAAKLTQHFRPPGSTPSLEITKQYITRVLPPPGDAYINVHYTFMPKGGLRPEQYKLPITGRAYKTVDEAIEGIAYRQGRSDTRDMWVCMTTQREAQETTDKTGRRKYLKAVRLAENAVAVKALWFDLDVEAGNPKNTTRLKQRLKGSPSFSLKRSCPSRLSSSSRVPAYTAIGRSTARSPRRSGMR